MSSVISYIVFSFRRPAISLKYVTLLHIIVTYIKENTIAKLQKLYSQTRNLRAGNILPALFLKEPICTGDLLPTHIKFIDKPVRWWDTCFKWLNYRKCSWNFCYRHCWLVYLIDVKWVDHASNNIDDYKHYLARSQPYLVQLLRKTKL